MAKSVSAKEKIENGFISLLNQKYFSEIKTVDIIKTSEVSHQTFYRLYSDKYQLAGEICIDLCSRFQLIYGESSTWKELTICLLNVIKNNSQFFKHLVLELEGSEIFRQSLEELSKILTGKAGPRPVYYIWLCVVREWAENKFQDSVPDIYKRLCYYLPIGDVISGKQLEDALLEYEKLKMEDFNNRMFPF